MENICATCGTLYGSALPPACRICSDERQYMTENGQHWTSLELLSKDHVVKFTTIAGGLHALSIMPSFAIGQRAFLVQHEGGNILWDCIPFIDQPAIAYIKSLGGISAIAISHPHFYSIMNVYAGFFDCPVYLHEKDKEWIMDRNDRYLRLWTGTRHPLWNGAALVHTGGHFPGSTILHLPAKHTVLAGDSILVGRNRNSVTCMYSYPNLIPLGRKDVEHIVRMIAPLEFDALYSAFDGSNISGGAREIFLTSMNRYLSILG